MIGIVVVMHKSEFRPNGFEFINDCIESLYKFFKKDFILYLFDNASVEKYKVPNHQNIKYKYIKDQTIRGLAGSINDGVNRAVEDGCDIIIIMNDDIIFNKTTNIFIDIIEKHEYKDISLYGSLTNGCLKTCHQYAEKPGKGIIEITNEPKQYAIVRGQFMAFTKEFYEKFKRLDGNMLSENSNHLWRGGEVRLLRHIRSLGGKTFIIKDCWVFHHLSKNVQQRLRILRKRQRRNKIK